MVPDRRRQLHLVPKPAERLIIQIALVGRYVHLRDHLTRGLASAEEGHTIASTTKLFDDRQVTLLGGEAPRRQLLD
jgi:hypothetical protein